MYTTHIENHITELHPAVSIACYRLPFRFCPRSTPGAALRARAIAPAPSEANRTALRTLRTFPSSPPPSPPASRLALFDEPPRSLPNFFISARFALFSDFSVGSNYTKRVRNGGVRRKEPCWRVPCASRRAASFRLRAYGRICPCSPCSLALSRGCVLSPPYARFVRALLGPWPVPVPVPAERVPDFAYVDPHFWPCAPCARPEPPSTGQSPHLMFKAQTCSVLFLPKKKMCRRWRERRRGR
jgi:hypothetical protein